MLLFYIRHGDPIYDPDSLTPLGKRQAESISHRLALFGLDRVFVSSSERAIQTAQPTCELLKISPTVMDWCHEKHAYKQLSMTDENGKRRWLFQHEPTRRLLCSEEVRKLGDKWYTHEAFAGTTYAEGIERIAKETDAWLAELGYLHLPEKYCYRVERSNDERIALFAHQGFGLAFLSYLLDIPYPLLTLHFDMEHTGMTVIEFAEQNGYTIPQVLQLSNDSHLYRDGLPTNYQNRLRF